MKKGDLAGTITATTDGFRYKQVFYQGRSYQYSRLIFLMFHGYIPECVTYRDKNTLNTCIENLMAASRSQVACYSGIKRNNKTGYKGVKYDKKSQVYVATIGKNGKNYHLGQFNNPEEAYQVYCKAAKKLHGEFAKVA